ncbi:MAG: transposase, partial [Candidatus Hydrogenedentes bacterium]|nr:transposase [Candidatus Hydrogenedentota bacterium]
AGAEEVVSIYRRRWWIETAFRDSKNRDWGMGLDMVKLKDYRRYERLFYIVALAFTLLSAHGALAEAEGVDKEAKANTRTTRVLNLLRIGIYYIKRRGQKISDAVDALKILATAQAAPNWG